MWEAVEYFGKHPQYAAGLAVGAFLAFVSVCVAIGLAYETVKEERRKDFRLKNGIKEEQECDKCRH